MKINAVWIDVLSNTPDIDVIQISNNSNDEIYSALDGAFFDCFYFQLKGDNETYLAFVDDCGMIKGLPISAMYEDRRSICLVGNIVICKPGKDGGIESLDKFDVIEICRHLATATNIETGKSYPVLIDIKKGVTQ